MMILIWLFSMTVQAQPAPDRIRIATWNVWHGFGFTPRGFGAWEESADRRSRAIKQTAALAAEAADVTLLQECNPLLERGAALASAGVGAWAGQLDATGVKVLGVGVPRGLDAGLLTVVNRPLALLGSRGISLSHPRWHLLHRRLSLQFREERFAQFNSIQTPSGTRVLVINTQLHDAFERPAWLDDPQLKSQLGETQWSKVDHVLSRGDRRRLREFGHILERIENLVDRFDLVVIAGDLNAAPDGALAASLKRAGFRDAWAEASGGVESFTYDLTTNALNERLQDQSTLDDIFARFDLEPALKKDLHSRLARHEKRPRRIDHVWVRAVNSVVRASAATRFGWESPTSDHFGLGVTLDIDPKR